MKLHKKFNHDLPGVHVWGERGEVDIRINFGTFRAGEVFHPDPKHYHNDRTTYFCVLDGMLIVEVEGKEIIVNQDAMLEVSSMEVYRTIGVGGQGCIFVVIGSHNKPSRIVVEN
ncbi:hypothetical protein KC866_01685 [Patescibacteria group bacterium]|nr:hypothetical protein [Patescibacteria group bacterium]